MKRKTTYVLIRILKRGRKDCKLSLENEFPCVKKDVIRSSLSVRLRDTSKGLERNNAYIRSHYVNALEEKSLLQDLTAGVISLRDAFQMYGWWSKTSI